MQDAYRLVSKVAWHNVDQSTKDDREARRRTRPESHPRSLEGDFSSCRINGDDLARWHVSPSVPNDPLEH